MFAMLRGTVFSKSINQAVIDVGGVGYDVQMSVNTHNALPLLNQETLLYIHTHVREDAIRLFGFATPEEREVFRLVITVNGIGPRMALNLLSGITPSEFVETIKQANMVRLTATPGIGKRLAERVILELKEKVVELGLEDAAAESKQNNRIDTILRDFVSALGNMGYKQNQVEKVIDVVKPDAEAGADLSELVRKGLRFLMKMKEK